MSKRTHSGIPTVYKGVQFRSRLEARWACFFDLCGWKWEYETTDLAGWIPDFLITPYRKVENTDCDYALAPSASFWVEVRPRDLQEGMVDKVCAAQGGRKWRDVLLVGEGPQQADGWFDIIGEIVHSFTFNPANRYVRKLHFGLLIATGRFTPELPASDNEDGAAPTLLQIGSSGHCLMLAQDMNISCIDQRSREIGRQLWVEAGNRTQWKGVQNHE